jgi:hypothetical protein
MNTPSIATKKKQVSSFLHGFKWSKALPIIISCFSLVVAVVAVIVSYNSTQNAVRPLLYVGVGDSQSPTPCFGLFVRNNGMGPARIKSVDIRFDAQPIPRTKDTQRVISQAGFPGRPIDFEILSVPVENGMVIGAGQEVLIFAGSKNQISNLGELESVLRRVYAHITYSSVTGRDYEVQFPNKKEYGSISWRP